VRRLYKKKRPLRRLIKDTSLRNMQPPLFGDTKEGLLRKSYSGGLEVSSRRLMKEALLNSLLWRPH
jgi:hypothetical protein